MTSTAEKFALLTYLTKSVQEKTQVGKKALQKLVHLTSEVTDVPFAYNFRLYTYGPFSRELAGDIDVLESLGILSVQFVHGRNGYVIETTDNAKSLLHDNAEFIRKNQKAIDKISEQFGERLAKDLEISSMLTFILQNDLVDDPSTDASVVEKFLEIKPHYQKVEVSNHLSEIRNLLV